MLNSVNCIECIHHKYKNPKDCPRCHGTKQECACCGAGWDIERDSCTRVGCPSYKPLVLEKIIA